MLTEDAFLISFAASGILSPRGPILYTYVHALQEDVIFSKLKRNSIAVLEDKMQYVLSTTLSIALTFRSLIF
jgi:hypothetical protein